MEKTNVIITIQSRQCFDTLEEDWVEQTAGGCLERTAEGAPGLTVEELDRAVSIIKEVC